MLLFGPLFGLPCGSFIPIRLGIEVREPVTFQNAFNEGSAIPAACEDSEHGCDSGLGFLIQPDLSKDLQCTIRVIILHSILSISIALRRFVRILYQSKYAEQS